MEERIKNIITDGILAFTGKDNNFKKGFFAGQYIRSSAPGSNRARLVTEESVKSFVRSGSVILRLSAGAIITPLADELLTEKNIKVIYE